MARTDWNHDGKNDMYDDYIEYKMYSDTTGDSDIPSGSSGYRRGMSAFGAVISTIGGLVAQAAFILLWILMLRKYLRWLFLYCGLSLRLL